MFERYTTYTTYTTSLVWDVLLSSTFTLLLYYFELSIGKLVTNIYLYILYPHSKIAFKNHPPYTPIGHPPPPHIPYVLRQ
jgi:hypothetical protein